MKADLIIPTIGKPQLEKAIESLRYVPFPTKVHIIRGMKWPEAVNKGIEESTNDILLMDDDVELSPGTFYDFEYYYRWADIFGFKLLHEDGMIQHAGGFCIKGALGHIGYRMEDNGKFDMPYLTCHCTSALLYIKRHVIEKIGGMATDYPGTHYHDVDFSFRALKAGFKIMYIPNMAWHKEGKTVSDDPELAIEMGWNHQQLMRRFADLMPELEKYPAPANLR